MPRKTPDQALDDVDKVALLKVKIAKIEAEKDEAVNKVLATYSEPISDLKTDLKRLSSRLRSWLITQLQIALAFVANPHRKHLDDDGRITVAKNAKCYLANR